MTDSDAPDAATSTAGLTRISFRVGDVFDPNDEVGMFVLALSATLNDLLYINRLVFRDERAPLLRETPTVSESVYLMRLVAGHVWEALESFRLTRQSRAITTFLDELPERGRSLCALITGFVDD